jgi:hypothetical protein
MTPDDRERVCALCARIVEERDSSRFEQLVEELAALLERKERDPRSSRPLD